MIIGMFKRKRSTEITQMKTEMVSASSIDNLQELLNLVEKFTLTRLQVGDIIIERPPILPQSTQKLEMSSSEAKKSIDSLEDFEDRLYNLGKDIWVKSP